MNFSIIDFETATPWRGSVCAVGLTVVRDGKIVEEFYSLINPQEHIHTFNTRLHHISDADIQNAPTFPEVWEHIVELVGTYPLGAHNSEFDMSAIQSAVAHWNVRPANFKIFDTLELFRAEFKCSHGCRLDEIAEYYGLQLNHHNAKSDASITAQCVLKLAESNNAASIYALLSLLGNPKPYSILYRAPIPYKDYVDRRAPKETHIKKTIPAKTPDKNILFTYGNELAEDRICITGELHYCSRDQAKKLIEYHGGRVTSSMTRRTNILLVGFYPNRPEGYISGKHKDALDSIAIGNDIKIWSESDFLSIVQHEDPDGKEAYEQLIAEREEQVPKKSDYTQPKRLVVQLLDDGTVVGVYPTVAAAAEHVKVAPKSIRSAATGEQKHAAGYCWRYVYLEDN